MNKKHIVYIHIFFWVYNILQSWFWIDIDFYRPDDKLTYFTFLGLSWLHRVLITYFIYFFVIPKFFFTKRYFILSCYFLLIFIFSTCITSGLWNELDFFKYAINLKQEQLASLFITTINFLFQSFMLSVLTEWVKINTQKAALEEEIKTTEYLFLKSQMSPHFLFNTLNNIYGLSITNHEKTPKAIAQLKGLMSYIKVYESGQKITLEEEYTHLTNYIALNELRYAVKVNWLIKVSNSSLLIEPMLLLPIIENAFKHGDTSEHGAINIYFSENNNKLTFECSNDIPINAKKDKTSGIGIQNVQKRLSLLYPNTSSLILDKSVEFFNMKISIKL